jgi:hypothetical protein
VSKSPALVTIPSEVPLLIQPFSEALQSAAIDAMAAVPAEVTGDNFDDANALYKRLKAIEKQIEDAHGVAKRPIIDAGRLLDDAKTDWVKVVKAARDVLGARIHAREQELARQRAAYEAEQRAIREAQIRAELERQRAEQAAEEALAVAARIEAQRQAALLASDDPFGDAPDTDVAIPVLRPVNNAYMQLDPPLDNAGFPLQAPYTVPVATIAPPPVVAKSAVKVTVRKKLVIHDAALVPREFCVPDERAIFDAMRGGALVPGCELVDESTVGAK